MTTHINNEFLFFQYLPSKGDLCFVFNTYPSSETRRAVCSLGLCSHPHFIHPSPNKTVFVGFLWCFGVFTFVVVWLTKRNAQRSSFSFFISNTYSSKSKNNGSGFLGCVSSSSFHLSGSPKNCLVVFVLPSFIHLSPPKTVVGIVLVLLLMLLAGHKSSSQSWTRKEETNEFFSPSFKTFPLQIETKTKWALSSCVYILILFISLLPKTFIVVFELSSFHRYQSPRNWFCSFFVVLIACNSPNKSIFCSFGVVFLCFLSFGAVADGFKVCCCTG